MVKPIKISKATELLIKQAKQRLNQNKPENSTKQLQLIDKTTKKPAKQSKKQNDDNLPAKLPPVLSNKQLKVDKRYLYQTVTEMETKVNAYFQDPSNQPYHIAGLRLALGMYHTETYNLYSNSRDPHYIKYNDLLKASKHIIESGMVDKLFNSKRYGAVIFYLKSQLGYIEQVEHVHSHQGSINIKFTAETPEERQRRIEQQAEKEQQVIDVTPISDDDTDK